MVPNFKNGDYLLVDELTYRFRSPDRGEVVVFRYPNDPSTYFIKRIIGLPGEKVVIKNDKIMVYNQANPDGIVITENYLPNPAHTNGNEEFKLKDGQYLTLGDNRSYSFDSRSWGPLPANDIVGLVRLRLWPITDFRAFAAPQY